MKYLGGKHRLGKKISLILKTLCSEEECKTYLEPFVGGYSVGRHMSNYENCIISDLNSDLIALWKAIKNKTFKPPTKKITEAYYNKVKKLESPHPLKAFVLIFCSWNGMENAGLATYNGTNRDPRKEALNDIKNIAPLLQKNNVKIYNKSYDSFNPKNALIYCDPPYLGTAGYSTGDFDHKKFWKKIRQWSDNGNICVISEETAPEDFVVIWEQGYARGAGFQGSETKIAKERLFMYKKTLDNYNYDVRTVRNKIKKVLKENNLA